MDSHFRSNNCLNQGFLSLIQEGWESRGHSEGWLGTSSTKLPPVDAIEKKQVI